MFEMKVRNEMKTYTRDQVKRMVMTDGAKYLQSVLPLPVGEEIVITKKDGNTLGVVVGWEIAGKPYRYACGGAQAKATQCHGCGDPGLYVDQHGRHVCADCQ
jgi:hypothetical protein